MKTKTLFYLLAAAALALSAFTPAPRSPFVGHWQAVDPADDSHMRLTIGGPRSGPFNITWTESYFSFCQGQPGIVRGTGWLGDDPHVLEADLRIQCFTTGGSLDFHYTWTYLAERNLLLSEDGPFFTLWHRPGQPLSELWAAMFAFNLPEGAWSEGEHTYHFKYTYTIPQEGSVESGEVSFTISDAAPLYDGYVLLRGMVKARVGDTCVNIDTVNPAQATQFNTGWLTDYPMTYEQARAHIGSMTVWAFWDGYEGGSQLLEIHEIVPFSVIDWQSYMCSFALSE